MTTKAVTVPSKRTIRTPATAPSAAMMVVDSGTQVLSSLVTVVVNGIKCLHRLYGWHKHLPSCVDDVGQAQSGQVIIGHVYVGQVIIGQVTSHEALVTVGQSGQVTV